MLSLNHNKTIFDTLGRHPVHPFPARMAPGIALDALGSTRKRLRVLDGIVALDNLQLGEVLDDRFDDQEGITIRRKLRHMYSVTGKNGKLARKVARDSLLDAVDRLTPGQGPSDLALEQSALIQHSSGNQLVGR